MKAHVVFIRGPRWSSIPVGCDESGPLGELVAGQSPAGRSSSSGRAVRSSHQFRAVSGHRPCTGHHQCRMHLVGSSHLSSYPRNAGAPGGLARLAVDDVRHSRRRVGLSCPMVLGNSVHARLVDDCSRRPHPLHTTNATRGSDDWHWPGDVGSRRSPLLIPNPFMGFAQRMIYVVEIFTQNFARGVTLALLLRRKDKPMPVPELSAPEP